MWGWDLVDLSSSQATWSWRASERRSLGEVSEDGRGVGPGEVGATGEDGVDIDVAGEVAEYAMPPVRPLSTRLLLLGEGTLK